MKYINIHVWICINIIYMFLLQESSFELWCVVFVLLARLFFFIRDTLSICWTFFAYFQYYFSQIISMPFSIYIFIWLKKISFSNLSSLWVLSFVFVYYYVISNLLFFSEIIFSFISNSIPSSVTLWVFEFSLSCLIIFLI